jgi:hypothetical protein
VVPCSAPDIANQESKDNQTDSERSDSFQSESRNEPTWPEPQEFTKEARTPVRHRSTEPQGHREAGDDDHQSCGDRGSSTHAPRVYVRSPCRLKDP